jgi:hypothetical protein
MALTGLKPCRQFCHITCCILKFIYLFLFLLKTIKIQNKSQKLKVWEWFAQSPPMKGGSCRQWKGQLSWPTTAKGWLVQLPPTKGLAQAATPCLHPTTGCGLASHSLCLGVAAQTPSVRGDHANPLGLDQSRMPPLLFRISLLAT